MRKLLPILVTAVVLAAAIRPQAAASPDRSNLVLNGGFEGPAKGQLPDGWEPLIIGARAKFTLDAAEHHGGGQSVRIAAPEVTRSYVYSAPVEVAPGEKLDISAWAKVKDVPPGQGTVIAIAEFLDGAGARSAPVMKVNTAKVPAEGWQEVRGSVTVPPLSAKLRLRLGFSYASGTVWWDDVTVRTRTPLAVRTDVVGARLPLSSGALPVTVLNREGLKGGVRLDVSLAGQHEGRGITLSGEPAQHVDFPFKVSKRGKAQLSVAVIRPIEDIPAFEETRAITIPPVLSLAPVSPTHWAVEDGAPVLECEVDLEASPDERRGAVLDVQLLDGSGASRGKWSPPSLTGGDTPFTLKTPVLPEGSYRLVAELKPTAGGTAKVEQPFEVIPRRRAETTLNAEGYLVKDGKAVFPLGIFNGGARMQEAAQAGFTVSHAYNAARVVPRQKADDQRPKDFLDSTLKAGMSAVMLVPMEYAFVGDWDSFRKRIRMFRNHPGLLCWDEEEGIARGDMKPADLAKMRQILREEDPHHPLMVGDSRDVVGRVEDRGNFFPLAQMDLGMWWWYPLPPGPKPGNALQGEELSKSFELIPPIFLTKRNTEKPVWVGVQSYKKPQSWARYPTAEEYRAQAYLALIHGAKGLMWYGGSVQGGLFLNVKEGNWDALKALATELHGLQDVFMAPSAPAPAVSPASAPVSVALKRARGKLYLLAANRNKEAVEVSFSVPNSGMATVLSESRSVAMEGGRLKDRFTGYQVHVYELGAAG